MAEILLLLKRVLRGDVKIFSQFQSPVWQGICVGCPGVVLAVNGVESANEVQGPSSLVPV